MRIPFLSTIRKLLHREEPKQPRGPEVTKFSVHPQEKARPTGGRNRNRSHTTRYTDGPGRRGGWRRPSNPAKGQSRQMVLSDGKQALPCSCADAAVLRRVDMQPMSSELRHCTRCLGLTIRRSR